jgi:hypothetical protein
MRQRFQWLQRLLCFLGLHRLEILTAAHGHDTGVGDLDDFEFNHRQYLHIKICRHCGHIDAVVTHQYWTDSRLHAEDPYWRCPDIGEVFNALLELDSDFYIQHQQKIENKYATKLGSGRLQIR